VGAGAEALAWLILALYATTSAGAENAFHLAAGLTIVNESGIAVCIRDFSNFDVVPLYSLLFFERMLTQLTLPGGEP
jgi:hypothetical protein